MIIKEHSLSNGPYFYRGDPSAGKIDLSFREASIVGIESPLDISYPDIFFGKIHPAGGFRDLTLTSAKKPDWYHPATDRGNYEVSGPPERLQGLIAEFKLERGK